MITTAQTRGAKVQCLTKPPLPALCAITFSLGIAFAIKFALVSACAVRYWVYSRGHSTVARSSGAEKDVVDAAIAQRTPFFLFRGVAVGREKERVGSAWEDAAILERRTRLGTFIYRLFNA